MSAAVGAVSQTGEVRLRRGRGRTAPLQLDLTLRPRTRYDAIDVTERVRQAHGDALTPYRRALYCSYHTTAGYLEQSLSRRLQHRREQLDPFIAAFRALFPPDADYSHDRLDLRAELSEEQRRVEPRNADSHLAFIGSGLLNCVTYINRPGEPVYFMDLDGVNGDTARTRHTTVLAYDDEETVTETRFAVPVSRHPIDSINLADPRVGLVPFIEDLVARHGVAKGRVDITLDPEEHNAGLTVNEHETLLMRHDLAEVLRDPLKFAMRAGKRALADPRAIPAKSLGYAMYDVVHIVNQLMDALRISESAVERLLARFMAVPAARFLRLKRSATFLVSDHAEPGRGALVQGRYQSPILLQWSASAERRRVLRLGLRSFA